MKLIPGFSLLIKILFFSLSSWLLLHFVALFGVFIAVAYPFWWFIAPSSLPDFLARLKLGPSGDLPSYPRTLSAALSNSLFIFVFTALSIGFVFLESRVLFRLGFPPADKTVSFIIPNKAQYRLNEIFPLKIEIIGIKQPINAIQADLSFDPKKLKVVDISTQDSFANIFIQKEINNDIGYARLTGGLPNPGFFSDHGLFGTVYFQGVSAGLARVDFLPSSLVLANDGRGSNVLKDFASASYLILAEPISQQEAELQTALIQPAVLGSQTDNTQIRLYTEGNVLGQQSPADLNPTKASSFNLFAFLAKLLKTVDEFIVSNWYRVFSAIRSQ